MDRTLRVLALPMALLLAGCSGPQVREHGAHGVTASFSRRTLSSLLPEQVRVPAAIAAAEETFRARGYTIVSAESTEEVGRVEARPPRTTDWPSVTFAARRMPLGTQVHVTVYPWGDQDLSRSILDGTLQKLGL
jgi:hypothetical protein